MNTTMHAATQLKYFEKPLEVKVETSVSACCLELKQEGEGEINLFASREQLADIRDAINHYLTSTAPKRECVVDPTTPVEEGVTEAPTQEPDIPY